MLTARLDGEPIEASLARRGDDHRCPECDESLILKQGRIVVPHFAHRPLTICSYGAGETLAHLQAKARLAAELRAAGYDVEVEPFLFLEGGNSHPDLLVRHRGRSVAVELQHSNIDLNQIERRTIRLAAMGHAVWWLPMLDFQKLGHAGAHFERFSARPYHRWLAELQEGMIWFYDVSNGELALARFSPHYIHVPDSEWYDSSGDLQVGGGYEYASRRWVELTVLQRIRAGSQRVVLRRRRAGVIAIRRRPWGRPFLHYRLPDCRYVSLQSTSDPHTHPPEKS